MTAAADIRPGDWLRTTAGMVPVTAVRVEGGLLCIDYGRGTRSGVLVRAARARVARLYGQCIPCEQASNGLSRGRHCGRCSCCKRRAA